MRVEAAQWWRRTAVRNDMHTAWLMMDLGVDNMPSSDRMVGSKHPRALAWVMVTSVTLIHPVEHEPHSAAPSARLRSGDNGSHGRHGGSDGTSPAPPGRGRKKTPPPPPPPRRETGVRGAHPP